MEYKEPLIFMRRSAMHANMTAVEKKSIFFHSFHPYFFSSKRKVSVFDLYSISRIKRTEYIPMLRAYARKQSKSHAIVKVDIY